MGGLLGRRVVGGFEGRRGVERERLSLSLSLPPPLSPSPSSPPPPRARLRLALFPILAKKQTWWVPTSTDHALYHGDERAQPRSLAPRWPSACRRCFLLARPLPLAAPLGGRDHAGARADAAVLGRALHSVDVSRGRLEQRERRKETEEPTTRGERERERRAAALPSLAPAPPFLDRRRRPRSASRRRRSTHGAFIETASDPARPSRA